MSSDLKNRQPLCNCRGGSKCLLSALKVGRNSLCQLSFGRFQGNSKESDGIYLAPSVREAVFKIIEAYQDGQEKG